MGTTLVKTNWTIDTNVVEASVAESIGGSTATLSMPVGSIASGYLDAFLSVLKSKTQTVIFWGKFVRGVVASGSEIEEYLLVRETGSDTVSKAGYKIKLANTAAVPSFTANNFYDYSTAGSLTNIMQSFSVEETGTTDLVGYTTFSSVYDMAAWNLYRVTSFDSNGSPVVIVERDNGDEWVLILEYVDKKIRTEKTFNIPGSIGFGTSSDSVEAAAETRIAYLTYDDAVDTDLMRSSNTSIFSVITSLTNLGDLVVSKEPHVNFVTTLVSVVDPENTSSAPVMINALRFTNTSGSSKRVELLLPVVNFENYNFKVNFMRSSNIGGVYYNLRKINEVDEYFYHVKVSGSTTTHTSSINRVYDPGTGRTLTELVNVSMPSSAGAWESHSITIQDEGFTKYPKITLKRAERTDSTLPLSGHTYSGNCIYHDINAPTDLINKQGFVSVGFDISNGTNITLAGVELNAI